MPDKFNKYKTNTAKALKRCGITDHLFARCIGIYFILSAVHILDARRNGINALDMWQTFIQIYPLKTSLIWFIISFGFISLLFYYFTIKSETAKKISGLIDPALLIGGTLFFSCTLMWRNDDFYLCIGICLTAAVLIIYGASRLKESYINVPVKATAIIVALISLLVAGFVCVTAISKHSAFRTNSFDLGIFVQMYHSMTRNMTAVTTLERDIPLSHFNIHASYIYYLLLPLYALFPSANTLIIAQVIITITGIIPVFLIAKKRNFKGSALFFACMIYLFSAGLLAPCYFDFHENAFLPPLLLWLLYAVEKRNYTLFFIMSALICIVKEDAPLYVICIALYLFIEEKGKDRFHALFAIIISTAYFLFINQWLTANGDGSMMMSIRFSHLTTDQNDGFIGIIRNVLSNPGYFISLFIQENTLFIFMEMLLPLAFLPFITKKIHRFLLMIPFVIMNLVIGTEYSLAAQMGYQYTFGTSALLIYMTLINISDFDTDRRRISIIAASALSVITAFSLISGHISYYELYKEREASFKEMESCLDAIPAEASAICYIPYLHHVADRDEVYMFDEDDFMMSGDMIIGLKDMEKYDFYVMHQADPNTQNAIPYLEEAGYTIFAKCGDTLIIYGSPAYSSGY